MWDSGQERSELPERMRSVLLITYAYPPCARSGGYLRPLALSRYLPRFGWRPLVLTAHARAFERVDYALNEDIPENTLVKRAFALDARRHLGIRERYPSLLALPDRWWSWWLGAVPVGLRLVRQHRPAVLWSTSPILTSHMIAWTLHRLTGVPWVADFRDPVSATECDGYRLAHRAPRTIERAALRHAQRVVFTAAGAAASYAQRYPERRAGFAVIPNGYDERKYLDIPRPNTVAGAGNGGMITLVHSGLLYADGRNPRNFLIAIAALKERGVVAASSLQVILRASGNDKEYTAQIECYGVGDIVHLRPSLTYSEALREQVNASALLLFQGRLYNRHIPAKVYEYFRAGRPIFALADTQGDTAALLREEGVTNIVPLDNAGIITEKLALFINALRSGTLKTPPFEQIARFSREAGTRRYARLFDDVARQRS